jgi:hypothetical protein
MRAGYRLAGSGQAQIDHRRWRGARPEGHHAKEGAVSTAGFSLNSTTICIFCQRLAIGNARAEAADAFAIEDAFSVASGHLRINTKRYVAGFFEPRDHESRGAALLMFWRYRELVVGDPFISA